MLWRSTSRRRAVAGERWTPWATCRRGAGRWLCSASSWATPEHLRGVKQVNLILKCLRGAPCLSCWGRGRWKSRGGTGLGPLRSVPQPRAKAARSSLWPGAVPAEAGRPRFRFRFPVAAVGPEPGRRLPGPSRGAARSWGGGTGGRQGGNGHDRPRGLGQRRNGPGGRGEAPRGARYPVPPRRGHGRPHGGGAGHPH